MAGIVIPGRSIGPRPPFNGVNVGSPLARGLLFFAPAKDDVLKAVRPLAGSTTATVTAAPDRGLVARCDAGNEAFSISAPSYLRLNAPLTISAWVYHLSSPTSYSAIASVTHNNTVTNPWIAYCLQTPDPATSYRFSVNNNPEYTWIDGGTVVTGQWRHLVGVVPSGQKYYFCLDAATKYTHASAIIGTIAYSDPYVYIGEHTAPGSYGRTINGLISDVCIWNRALSDAEVSALYHPSTRWDLYWQPSRKIYFDIPKRRATTFPIPNVPGVSRELDLTLGTGIRPALFYLPQMTRRYDHASGLSFRNPISSAGAIGPLGASRWGSTLHTTGVAHTMEYCNSGPNNHVHGGPTTMLMVANPSARTGANVLLCVQGTETVAALIINGTKEWTSSEGRLAGHWQPYSYQNSTQTDETTIVDGTYKVFGMVRTPGTACALWVNGQKPAQTSNAANSNTYGPFLGVGIAGYYAGNWGCIVDVVLVVIWNHALPDSVMAQLSHPDLVMQRVWARRPAYLDAGEPATGRQSAAIIIPGRNVQATRPPFYGIDPGSPQAKDLALWYPIGHHDSNTTVYPAHGYGSGVGPLVRQNANTWGDAEPPYGHTARTLIASPNGYLKGGDNVPLVGDELTISMWLYLDDSSWWSALISKAVDQITDSNQWDWGLLGSGGDGGFYLIRNGGNVAAVSWSSFLDRWAHLVARMSSPAGRNTSSLWIDGKVAGSGAGIGSAGATPNTSGRYVQLGGIGLTARMADVRVYNRYLTDPEVYALYDPRTRWDLYWQPNKRIYHDLGAAAPTGGQGPRTYYYMGHVWSR